MNGAGTANAPSLPTPVDPVPDHPMRRGYMIIQRLLLPVFLTAALACGSGCPCLCRRALVCSPCRAAGSRVGCSYYRLCCWVSARGLPHGCTNLRLVAGVVTLRFPQRRCCALCPSGRASWQLSGPSCCCLTIGRGWCRGGGVVLGAPACRVHVGRAWMLRVGMNIIHICRGQ